MSDYYESFDIEHGGKTYTVELYNDPNGDTPWENEDGHGPVTDWEQRDKAPGELVLWEEGGSARFYDFAQACELALEQSWGASPYKLTFEQDADALHRATGQWLEQGEPQSFQSDWHEDINDAVRQVCAAHRATFSSSEEYAARAAWQDYERLREWCSGRWSYVGVVVRPKDACPCCGPSESLWGVESDCDITNDVVLDLIEELLQRGGAS